MRDLTNEDDLGYLTEVAKSFLISLFKKLETTEKDEEAEAMVVAVLVTCLSVVLKNTLSIEEKQEFVARFSEYITD